MLLSLLYLNTLYTLKRRRLCCILTYSIQYLQVKYNAVSNRNTKYGLHYHEINRKSFEATKLHSGELVSSGFTRGHPFVPVRILLADGVLYRAHSRELEKSG